MGEKSGEERKPEPNLELPSIFGRRKKRRRAEPDDAERSQGAPQQSVITEEPPSSLPGPDTADPQTATAPVAGSDRGARAGRTDMTHHATSTDEAPTTPPEAEATRRLPGAAYAGREQDTSSAPDAAETAPRPGTDSARDSTAHGSAADSTADTAYIAEPGTAAESNGHIAQPGTTADGTSDTEDVPEPASSARTGRAADQRTARRAGGRRAASTSSPALPGPVAAVLTGLVVGLFGAAATYGGTQACDAWRGTTSCGGGPGLLLLIAILALMVLLGAVLLALLAVPEPRSTSFLGVGLTFVVVLVALMSAVFSVWMFFAAPVLSAVAYGVAHWVTTRHVEMPERGPEHDVR